MAFEGYINEYITILFKDVRETLREKPQLLPAQLDRLNSQIRRLAQTSGDDKVRLFWLYINFLTTIVITYVTFLLRKKFQEDEFRQRLVKAGLSEGEAMIVLDAVRNLTIVDVTDSDGKVDVRYIIQEVGKKLELLDEGRKRIALSEVINFIHMSLRPVCSEALKEIDKALEDISKSLPNWDSLRESLESYLLKFDKMNLKLDQELRG
jgi:hypothetical protein